MSLPEGFVNLINSYRAPCLDGLVDTLLTTTPETTVRLNAAKDIEPLPDAKIVPWWPGGIYLDQRPAFTFDPALHQGLYYVQDASSMAIGAAVKAICNSIGNPKVTYLDACAAPGGKTLAALDALPAGSTVFSNEYDFRRAAVLAENIAKWGSPRTIVTRGDTSRYSKLHEIFDIIAADVPCSGEGMMRKEAEAVSQWSPALVAECAAKQRQIVENLWPALRPGGYFIYSTCTFNRQENEENVEYICNGLGGTSVDIGLDTYAGVATGIDTKHHCYRFVPGKVRGEGLFMAVIRKDDSSGNQSVRNTGKRNKQSPGASFDRSAIKRWFVGDYDITTISDSIAAIPADMSDILAMTSPLLDIVSAGICAATLKGRDIIPSQPTALTTALRKDAFTSVELSYRDAISFLRCENIGIDSLTRGHVLLKYQGHPLGFVKNLGNRANNLYPRHWRVLSHNVPTQAPFKPFYRL